MGDPIVSFFIKCGSLRGLPLSKEAQARQVYDDGFAFCSHRCKISACWLSGIRQERAFHFLPSPILIGDGCAIRLGKLLTHDRVPFRRRLDLTILKYFLICNGVMRVSSPSALSCHRCITSAGRTARWVFTICSETSRACSSMSQGLTESWLLSCQQRVASSRMLMNSMGSGHS